MLLELSRAAARRRRRSAPAHDHAGGGDRVREALYRTATARFSDRLDVRYAISPDSERCAVPAFLLQPVVENAFRHGFARRSGSCRLELAASVDGSQLHLSVRDDGAGLPADFNLVEHAGTGLGNARLRLQRLYDGAAQLRLEQADGGGTIARIRLPVSEANRPVHPIDDEVPGAGGGRRAARAGSGGVDGCGAIRKWRWSPSVATACGRGR